MQATPDDGQWMGRKLTDTFGEFTTNFYLKP